MFTLQRVKTNRCHTSCLIYVNINVGKCHLPVTGNYEVSANIDEFEIESSKKEKLLGILIDTTLEHHITSLCKKVSQKLHGLVRIGHCMEFKKRRSFMKAFVISQFNYSLLIRMFRNRALNSRINKTHKRALQLLYQNKNLSFSELLQVDNADTIHTRNLQVPLTEIFKVRNNLSLEIMKQIFDFQEPYYNLRSETSQFRRENIKTTHCGFQSVKLCQMVPENIKNWKSLQEFKKLIKVWNSKLALAECAKVRCKYLLHLTKDTPFIRFIVFH